MEFLFESFQHALRMLISLEQEMVKAVLVSVKVSFLSTFLATLTALPLAFLVGMKNFWGKRFVMIILNTLMSLPTVVIGLLVYSLISRRALLGNFGLLYTPWAIVIGQFLLALPIITALSLSAIQSIDPRVEKTARTLGATPIQTTFVILSEGRLGIGSAIITGFSRVFGEVGVSMMLGGNIRGYTRNITTAIAFETTRGEFALGLALGIILLLVSLLITSFAEFLRSHTQT
jgi:tungstate transport system permease protein